MTWLRAVVLTAGLAQLAAAGPDAETEAAVRARVQRTRTIAAYQARIVSQMRPVRFYPDEARREGHTGTVRVRFVVKADGTVARATVAGSSGHSTLDEAAVSIVLRAAPFPPLPPELGTRMTFDLPMRFELVEDRGKVDLL